MRHCQGQQAGQPPKDAHLCIRAAVPTPQRTRPWSLPRIASFPRPEPFPPSHDSATSFRRATLVDDVRSAYLDDAEPEAISHAIRAVLERRGAMVTEHRHSRVRFEGLRSHALTWSRAGYVGIYQAQGEREAEVRLQLRARWPWRLLLTVAITNVALLVFAIITNPPGTTWSILAILGGLALIATSMVHIGTLRSVRAEEKDLMDDLDTELAHIPDVEILTDEERELRTLESELEGEIVKRRLDADRPAKEKGSRFTLKPKPSTASQEDRRAQLLARKAELEARKAERDAHEPKP